MAVEMMFAEMGTLRINLKGYFIFVIAKTILAADEG